VSDPAPTVAIGSAGGRRTARPQDGVDARAAESPVPMTPEAAGRPAADVLAGSALDFPVPGRSLSVVL